MHTLNIWVVLGTLLMLYRSFKHDEILYIHAHQMVEHHVAVVS